MRSEADLVVDDDVQRPAGAEATRLRHLERLHHDALASERGVPVDNDGHDQVAGRVAPSVLPGAYRTFDHGADNLEVRRVERERDVHLAS